jgi:small subunit ribosomal protein S18
MARSSNNSSALKKQRRRRPEQSSGPARGGRRMKRRVCAFCQEKSEWIDYKDVAVLRRYISDRGKIRARRVNGNCPRHQREMANAVKVAREMALLPYVGTHR